MFDSSYETLALALLARAEELMAPLLLREIIATERSEWMQESVTFLRFNSEAEVSKRTNKGALNMADDRKSNQGGKKQGSSQQGGSQEGGSKGGGKQAGSQQGDKGNKQGGGRQSER